LNQFILIFAAGIHAVNSVKALTLQYFRKMNVFNLNLQDLFTKATFKSIWKAFVLLAVGLILTILLSIEQSDFGQGNGLIVLISGTIISFSWFLLYWSLLNKRDISQQMTETLTEELWESKEKLSLLIKNSNDIFVLVNEKGEQFFISDAVQRITGYSADELMGPILDVIYPEDKELIRKHWNDLSSYKNEQHRVQYRHKHKTKGYIWFEAVGQNLLNNPAINAVVVNIRDITTNKESEIKLRQNQIQLRDLNATKDKLFSIIAHDLRSPFNTILGFSDVLIKKAKKEHNGESKRISEIISSSARNTLVLLENLLYWAKSQSGQLSFNPGNINLLLTTNEIIGLLDSAAKIKDIKLNNLHQAEIFIYADIHMLKTTLLNLISNAIKFTNIGGEIDISSKSDQIKIEIVVSDNGIGMSKDIINKLFTLDPEVVANGTANEKGSGLGLILCKDFVEKHSGQIWVESEIGKGSQFKFTMPMGK
jgi:two-component system sensor histidine kinase/response regulator